MGCQPGRSRSANKKDSTILTGIVNEPIGVRSRIGAHKSMLQRVRHSVYRVNHLTLVTTHNPFRALAQAPASTHIRRRIPPHFSDLLLPLISNRARTAFLLRQNISVHPRQYQDPEYLAIGLPALLRLMTHRLTQPSPCPFQNHLVELATFEMSVLQAKKHPLIDASFVLPILLHPLPRRVRVSAICHLWDFARPMHCLPHALLRIPKRGSLTRAVILSLVATVMPQNSIVSHPWHKEQISRISSKS